VLAAARLTYPYPTISDIEDIYFSLQATELPAVMTLARRRRVPEGARHALRSMTWAASDGDVMAQLDANTLFHRELVAGVGSDRLSRMHRAVMGEAQLCVSQASIMAQDLDELVDLSAEIVTAVRNGTEQRARTALREDLLRLRDTLTARLRLSISRGDSAGQ
jgi:DNA-binding GntR family transcriptional regulator